MFKLHGSPISNYYSIVKLALLEKGLDFEEVQALPAQTPEYLAISPMGKIPLLQVREGYLSETAVIVDFLEDIYPEIPLFPSDPFEKAEVKRLCHMAELYIDLAVRPMLMPLFGGEALSAAELAKIKGNLEQGLAGIARVAAMKPWLAGDTFTAADIFFYYSIALVEGIAVAPLSLNIADHLPGYGAWRAQVAARDFVQQVDAIQQAGWQAFLHGKS